GSLIWIDLRDRYGITQLIIEGDKADPKLLSTVKSLGREYVIGVKGTVIERVSKNSNIPTGDIEISPENILIHNASETPPFTIDDDTDGGEDLRMKYRYIDLRRNTVKEKLLLRHTLARLTRAYLDGQQFIEVETPVLIKSTPEGARDFVVPSRMNKGEFYALPQSPQTFKQLLMVSGFDRYYQIVKCFRDEDLRADRQPEFTQIDCEMSFVTQEDILNTFEGLTKSLFKDIKSIDLPDFPRMSYDDAMRQYGSDKPDIRFEMKFIDLSEAGKGHGFNVFDQSEVILGICVKGCAEYTRKQIDSITDWVKRPQIGAKGMVYVKFNEDGSVKSSVDKFYNEETLSEWGKLGGAEKGDLMLILSGDKGATQKALGELRLYMADLLELRKPNEFKPLWVVDFPMLEWDEETSRFYAMHHPFTSPKPEDLPLLESNPGAIRANAYDLVINGVEIGGGSIRIHDRNVQEKVFTTLGFSKEEANHQFGFLLNAFKYGAPPHGGIAFGFDRMCALFGGSDSIRDYIAFPKNNAGRDVMIDTPSTVAQEQLDELGLTLKLND
ncbi:MAG: aspartate--tRNA ligase, partial [Cyclobacteriaceae bacterium]|nr:aspartate--tRNA ligase [Cyclobacteriaceae bacterium]